MANLKEVDMMPVVLEGGYDGMVFAVTTEGIRYYMGRFKDIENDGHRISLYELETDEKQVMTVDWYLLKQYCRSKIAVV